jgi:hypothetical protein
MSDDGILLRGFTISQVMDCIADPTKNRVIAELWDEVGEVLGAAPHHPALTVGGDDGLRPFVRNARPCPVRLSRVRRI